MSPTYNEPHHYIESNVTTGVC